MGWIVRECMVKGCSNLRADKVDYDDTYDEENPFLCSTCTYADYLSRNQPDRSKREDSLNGRCGTQNIVETQ